MAIQIYFISSSHLIKSIIAQIDNNTDNKINTTFIAICITKVKRIFL